MHERFWAKVDKNGPPYLDSVCWIWTGGLGSTGYGSFWDGSKTVSAHRLAYELVYGTPLHFPTSHRCGISFCVNPEHLAPEVKRSLLPMPPSTTIGGKCQRGHPREGEHLGFAKTGTRFCRTCAKDRKRATRAAIRKHREEIMRGEYGAA